MKTRGLFISFEGGEGAGKTTLISALEDYFSNFDRPILFTREPGGVVVAEQIRKIILDNQISPKTEVLLYAAARNEHFERKILPVLNDGGVVFCDRFLDSSLVYQGGARGISKNEVLAVNDFVLNGFRPDLTILLDVDPEISQKRIFESRKDKNRFDLENMDFHHKIRDEYLALAQKNTDRFVVFDASKSVEDVFREVLSVILEKIDLYFSKVADPNFGGKRILYTDGSASPNPGPGGFAIIENGKPIFLGNEKDSTNIRMEGLAIKKALEILDRNPAEIWTDSEFWINVLTKWAPNWKKSGWKKKNGEIKNLDIVMPLFELYEKSQTELKWLKGHAGHDFNEMADEWANRARNGEKI